MKKTFLAHPVLFAVFPIFSLYLENKAQLLPKVLVGPVLVSLGTTLILWLLLAWRYQSREKASWFLSFFWLGFFSYGRLAIIVGKIQITVFGPVVLTTDHLLLGFSLLLFGLLIKITGRTQRSLQFENAVFTVVGLTLISLTLGQLVPYELTRKPVSLHQPTGLTKTRPASQSNPDIYYIILDRYASAQTLTNFYQFDNRRFINFLTNQGFYVASQSAANYPKTYLSLASSLNLTHLTHLTERLGPNTSDLNHAFTLMKDFRAWRFLKRRGYRFIYFGNWWDQTQTNPFADLNFNYRFGLNPSNFSTELLKTTLLYPLLKKSGSNPLETPLNINYVQAKTALYTFKKLAEAPDLPGPKFVYAHLTVPHLPYVFDRDGKVHLDRGPLFTSTDYLEQLIFVNRQISRVLEVLLARSKPQPVVILQSDEGPYSTVYGNQGEEIDWTKLSDEDLRLHLGILNAYYFPNEEAKKNLYPSISPVNTFRVVFNSLFGTSFKLLPDTIYIIPDTNHPYQFIDVTDRIGNPAGPQQPKNRFDKSSLVLP